VKGIVDESLRALVDVPVAADKNAALEPLTVWIDTAFNGCLVIPRPQIERLGLKQGSTTQAILADGHLVDLETFTCYLDWFGKVSRTQVVANDGEYPLLGTMLLADRKLVIDYTMKSVTLT
jgi:clan AA aspartic protease